MAAGSGLSGFSVVSGRAELIKHGFLTEIHNSPGAVITWQSFSFARNRTVWFKQENTSSSVLNRVTGGLISEIDGRLTSNGRVFLINPAGIVFGSDPEINTAGLIASSLNLSNAAFKRQNYVFKAGLKSGLVENKGIIEVTFGGFVALIGGQVKNIGLIRAPLGRVILAAGEEAVLTPEISPHLSFFIGSSGQAVNLGTITASGGTILLRDRLSDRIVDQASIGQGNTVSLIDEIYRPDSPGEHYYNYNSHKIIILQNTIAVMQKEINTLKTSLQNALTNGRKVSAEVTSLSSQLQAALAKGQVSAAKIAALTGKLQSALAGEQVASAHIISLTDRLTSVNATLKSVTSDLNSTQSSLTQVQQKLQAALQKITKQAGQIGSLKGKNGQQSRELNNDEQEITQKLAELNRYAQIIAGYRRLQAAKSAAEVKTALGYIEAAEGEAVFNRSEAALLAKLNPNNKKIVLIVPVTGQADSEVINTPAGGSTPLLIVPKSSSLAEGVFKNISVAENDRPKITFGTEKTLEKYGLLGKSLKTLNITTNGDVLLPNGGDFSGLIKKTGAGLVLLPGQSLILHEASAGLYFTVKAPQGVSVNLSRLLADYNPVFLRQARQNGQNIINYASLTLNSSLLFGEEKFKKILIVSHDNSSFNSFFVLPPKFDYKAYEGDVQLIAKTESYIIAVGKSIHWKYREETANNAIGISINSSYGDAVMGDLHPAYLAASIAGHYWAALLMPGRVIAMSGLSQQTQVGRRAVSQADLNLQEFAGAHQAYITYHAIRGVAHVASAVSGRSGGGFFSNAVHDIGHFFGDIGHAFHSAIRAIGHFF